MNSNENNIKIPKICPNCGKPLIEGYDRIRRHGSILVCTGYPECRYIFDLFKKNTRSRENNIK